MTAPGDGRLARGPGLAGALESAGDFAFLAARVGARVWRRPFELGAFIDQVEAMGIRSLSVAALTAIFSCMVMAVQFTVQMSRFGAQDYVSFVLSLSQVRELGPVLTALIAGGRIGAGITAEIGSMAVTEQIDAMRSMGADPLRKLVVPRVLAGAVALPILTTVANVVGIAAAMVMTRLQSGVRMVGFYQTAIGAVRPPDVFEGLLKSVVFGVAISLVACHQGLRARGGTEGVGRVTTRTVVITSAVTLIADFAFTKLLLLVGV